ncbi:MAG: hypothetical protein MNPFHGCM_00441 [Gemmatimonadaceae bacterium]|nr:hypothetical protein [Gemmatimonadaceae bacterium]
MSPLMRKLAKKGKGTARRALDKAETQVMAAVGRKTVRKNVKAVTTVGREAVKAGMVAGAMAAAGVVIGAVRKKMPNA